MHMRVPGRRKVGIFGRSSLVLYIVWGRTWAVLISKNYEVFEYIVTNKARSQGKEVDFNSDPPYHIVEVLVVEHYSGIQTIQTIQVFKQF